MKTVLCYILGHKYQIEQQFNFNCQKLNCKRCKKKFAINHNMKIILPWDREFEMLHEHEIKKQSIIQK